MSDDYPMILNQIAQSLFDKKGKNILVLDSKKKASIADYFIIAEGSVNRHVVALANDVKNLLSDQGEEPLHIEGIQEGKWVVLDYGYLIVHLLVPEMRDKYRIEEVWKESSIVDVNIKLD